MRLAMRAAKSQACLVVLGVLALSTAAYAQPYDDPETEEALRALDPNAPPPEATESGETQPPLEQHAMPLPPPRRAAGIALPAGRMVATVTVEASLSKGTAFEPTSIAPDFSYGLRDGITLSLVHSGFATTGFRGSAGGGICVTGSDRGCPKVYNNAGAEVLADLIRGDFAVAAVAGFHALSFDPLFLDAKLGAQTMYRAGRITATFNPSVLVGVNKRAETAGNNKGGVFLPVSVGAQLTDPFFLAIGGGWATPLADASDGWTARLGLIARMRVAPGTFVAGSFFFPKLAGGDSVMGTGADARTLNLWLTYTR